MFKDQRLTKPKNKSLLGALATTFAVGLGSQISPVLGYVLALSTLVMIIVAMHMESIWPSQTKKENSLIFSLFWGLILGIIVPYIITVSQDGGASAILDIFTTRP